ncbi:UNVERIFIED_CONTAM: hypothetical protein HDU68_006197, partial [Siphonaria sp. JEL0065]
MAFFGGSFNFDSDAEIIYATNNGNESEEDEQEEDEEFERIQWTPATTQLPPPMHSQAVYSTQSIA